MRSNHEIGMPEPSESGSGRFEVMGHPAQVWSSYEQARESGLSHEDIWRMCVQVSDAVNAYNADNPSEMLRKTPENVLQQFQSGCACLIGVQENGAWQFGYHGGLYPAFEAGEECLAGAQVVEFGTDITSAAYRGHGLGQIGLQTRLSMLEQWEQPGVEVVGLATVKRLVTGYVYGKMEVHPVSYWELPYLSFLTDTCEGTSERFGHEACHYRRSPEESSRSQLRDLFRAIGVNAAIPCTMVVLDHEAAQRFDQRMRRLHQQWLGQSVEPGAQSISVDSYAAIDQFFQILQQRSAQR